MMIRFIFDVYSSDILVLTERSTNRVDFYYIADYLGLPKDDNYDCLLSEKEVFTELLLYWKTLIEHAIDDAFLIYDLSDQYIAAFHLEKFSFKGRPYWRTTRKSTTDLTGSGVSKDITVAELKSKNWRIDADFLIQANRGILLKGIDWSMENLRLNTHTVEV